MEYGQAFVGALAVPSGVTSLGVEVVVDEQSRKWPLATLGERNVRNPAYTTVVGYQSMALPSSA
jgi:hypothetical protein